MVNPTYNAVLEKLWNLLSLDSRFELERILDPEDHSIVHQVMWCSNIFSEKRHVISVLLRTNGEYFILLVPDWRDVLDVLPCQAN